MKGSAIMPRRKTKEQFIRDAIKVHGNKYNYSKVVYKNSKIKVIIICPYHGDFLQRPNDHLMNHGCPECKSDKQTKLNSKGFKYFRDKDIELNGSRGSYFPNTFIHSHLKSKFRCDKCGRTYWSTFNNRVYHGCGCPYCSLSGPSKAEIEIGNYIQTLYKDEIILNSKQIIKPLELDIYLPDINLAIEYNGTYWHSRKFKPKGYHRNKTQRCADLGIRLFHIPERAWTNERGQKLWKLKIKNYIKI